MRSKRTGIFFVLLASVCWALETVVAKFSFSKHDFLQIVFQQGFYCFLTVFVFILLIGKEELQKVRKLTKKDFGLVLFIGIAGSFIAYFFFYYGITKTYALNANLLAHIQPLFVSLLGLYFLKERLNRNDVLGGLLLILSAVLISSRTISNIAGLRLLSFGDLMVLVATVFWALVVIPAKHLLKRIHPAALIAMRFIVSSILFAVVLVSVGRFNLFSVYGLIIGVVTGCGYMFYYQGLRMLKAAQTSMIELSAPFFTVVLAFFVLGEVMTVLQVGGMALLFLGVYIISRREETAQLAEV